jgi:hypothetical protein
MPRVLDIQRRHMELGRIRLGERGAKGQPTRLDTWRLTSASRDLLESAAKVYGGAVEEWTDAPDKGYWQLTTDTASLDVIVPPGDPYSQFYELWSGGGCKRRCDGATELLSGEACKCDPEERECKITTRVNVMLPRVAGLGVWRLESHGYYAAAELPDALDLLQQISGGRMVSGVLRIEQRSSKKDGRTNRYPVPVLDLPNVTLASLVGNQVVVNPPAQLETGKPPLLDGPPPTDEKFHGTETPGFGERPALPSFDPPAETPEGPLSAPAASDGHTRAGDKRERLLEVLKERGMGHDALERYAAIVGIPVGAKATDEQLDALIEAIEGHGTEAVIESAESVPTPAEESSEPGVHPAPGAPPKPGTDEYKALAVQDKANARAYWSKPVEQQSLAEQMGAPA